MSRLRRSLLVTFFSSNGATAINFIVTLVLARFLSPEDVGVFSIASVMVAVAQIFRDFGVGAYLQHEKELTPQKIRSATGVLIASSWSLALLIYLSSATAARYFEHQGVGQVMNVLALGFIFIPLGAATNALLTRELRAEDQAIVCMLGTMSFATTSILLAYWGFGYMASAWANLANILVTGIAFIPFRPKGAPWLPSFRNWGGVVRFGSGAVLSNSVGAINTALPDLMLGKLGGAHDVGLFSRASGLSGLLMRIIGPAVNYAALPHMSKVFHQTGSVSSLLAKASALLSGLAWPVLVVLALFSHESILVLYGDTWLDSAPLVPATCAIVAIALSVHFVGTSLTATGRPYLAVLPNAFLLIFRVAAIFWIYDGSLISFAHGMLLGSLLAIPAFVYIQQRFLAFGVISFMRSQFSSIMVTALVGIVGLLIKVCLPSAPAYLVLCVAALGCIPAWVFAVYLTRHPLREELWFLQTKKTN